MPKLPSATSIGREINSFLQKDSDYTEAVSALKAEVGQYSSYNKYKEDHPRTGGLTKAVFNLIRENPETAHLFINPSTSNLYSLTGQGNVLRTAQDNGALQANISIEDMLARGMNRGGLLSSSQGTTLHTAIVQESRANVEVENAKRQALVDAEKAESQRLARNLYEADPSRYPQTRERLIREKALQYASYTPPAHGYEADASYKVVINKPDLLARYEEKLPKYARAGDPMVRAVEHTLSVKEEKLKAAAEEPRATEKERVATKSAAAQATERSKSFQARMRGEQPTILTPPKDEPAKRAPVKPIERALPQQEKVQIPAEVVATKTYTFNPGLSFSDLTVKRDNLPPVRYFNQNRQFMNLKIDETVHFQGADFSIKRLSKTEFQFIFHKEGDYQLSGAYRRDDQIGREGGYGIPKLPIYKIRKDAPEEEQKIERATPTAVAKEVESDPKSILNERIQKLNKQMSLLDYNSAVTWSSYMNSQARLLKDNPSKETYDKISSQLAKLEEYLNKKSASNATYNPQYYHNILLPSLA
ncbi:MAG: hypothetical protein KBC84_00905 [Proteobacteria bacterium]|nr:hypothetical protein [Pseudomonadota bacterium]